MKRRNGQPDFEISVASTPDNIPVVEAFVEEKLKERVPSEDDRDSIAIALTEVVSNAIYHGNKQDPNKKVFVRGWIEAGKVRLEVQDQGEGFDPNSLGNPLDPENLMKDSGRGIFILKALMDEVHFDFSQGGTLVTLVKLIASKPEAKE
ncbi:MAG: ATP-binding protein [Calditrichaeota bacterium]|nr:ATP-binding protein [Calditrichota bacterium]